MAGCRPALAEITQRDTKGQRFFLFLDGQEGAPGESENFVKRPVNQGKSRQIKAKNNATEMPVPRAFGGRMRAGH